MFNLFQKLIAVVEGLVIAVSSLFSVAPAVSPVPSPTVEVVEIATTSKATPTPVPSPAFSVTPKPAPSSTPIPNQIEKLIQELKELKEQIVAYTPEPTPTPIVVYVPVPTPTPIQTPEPTPTPTPIPEKFLYTVGGDLFLFNATNTTQIVKQVNLTLNLRMGGYILMNDTVFVIMREFIDSHREVVNREWRVNTNDFEIASSNSGGTIYLIKIPMDEEIQPNQRKKFQLYSIFNGIPYYPDSLELESGFKAEYGQ